MVAPVAPSSAPHHEANGLWRGDLSHFRVPQQPPESEQSQSERSQSVEIENPPVRASRTVTINKGAFDAMVGEIARMSKEVTEVATLRQQVQASYISRVPACMRASMGPALPPWNMLPCSVYPEDQYPWPAPWPSTLTALRELCTLQPSWL